MVEWNFQNVSNVGTPSTVTVMIGVITIGTSI